MTAHEEARAKQKQGRGGAVSTLVGQIIHHIEQKSGKYAGGLGGFSHQMRFLGWCNAESRRENRKFRAIEAEPSLRVQTSRCAIREMTSMLHHGLLTFGFLRIMPAPRTLTSAGAGAWAPSSAFFLFLRTNMLDKSLT